MARESEQQVLTLTTSGEGTTTGRMSEIERGKGEPPTEAELSDLAAFKRHPVVRQMQAGGKRRSPPSASTRTPRPVRGGAFGT